MLFQDSSSESSCHMACSENLSFSAIYVVRNTPTGNDIHANRVGHQYVRSHLPSGEINSKPVGPHVCVFLTATDSAVADYVCHLLGPVVILYAASLCTT